MKNKILIAVDESKNAMMAVEAGNVGTGVPAMGPIGEYAGAVCFVTPDAGHSLFGHAALYPKLLCLWQVFALLGLRPSGGRYDEKACQPNGEDRF